ncbi:MAG: anthranilate synthase component I [Legionellales bacterium]|nr:MAG: anthranilate synthase component I [Legionellales bacterium]
MTMQSYGRKISLCEDGNIEVINDDPIEFLRAYKDKLNVKTKHPLSEILAGMTGFVAYDAVRLFEDIPDSNVNIDAVPDLLFKFYNDLIVFDHQLNKIVLSSIAHIDASQKNLKQSYLTAMENIDAIIEKLSKCVAPKTTLSNTNKPNDVVMTCSSIETDIDDKSYMQMVEIAKQYIKAGDIFQIVLSRRFRKKYAANPFEIYKALSICSPSPYMFYLDNTDFQIVGASPEKLVSVENGIIESCPLAGTRPRGKNPQDDANMAEDLLNDGKETAEHMMLVDLARNDVGAVATPATVNVTRLKEIQRFSHVMHLSSTVQGKLREDLDAFDTLRAAFPAGTLSGAPKIRAMQILDGLENSRRGIYGGAICALSGNGDLISCIAIRMAVLKDKVATIRTGAGIVFDSDAKKEVEETGHKAKSVFAAIQLAETWQQTQKNSQ